VPPNATSQTAASDKAVSTQQSAPAAQSGPATYPVVHFTQAIKGQGVWPFTAQLANLTENPNGFPGSPGAPPQDTYLMVQLNIVSQTTGREVPPPDLLGMIFCHGFRTTTTSPEDAGFDEGSETAPDSQGFRTALGDGQPHLWDLEYRVPVGTAASRVGCVFGPDPIPNAELFLKVVGAGKLN
jgi:hypothetical protein